MADIEELFRIATEAEGGAPNPGIDQSGLPVSGPLQGGFSQPQGPILGSQFDQGPALQPQFQSGGYVDHGSVVGFPRNSLSMSLAVPCKPLPVYLLGVLRAQLLRKFLYSRCRLTYSV